MNNTLIFEFSNHKLTSEEILNSSFFKDILHEYLCSLESEDIKLYNLINDTFIDNIDNKIHSLFIELLSGNYSNIEKQLLPLSEDKYEFLSMIDGIYDVWRSKQRYALINSNKFNIESSKFVSLNEEFQSIIVSTYRKIYENVLGHEQIVYRQLPSGTNASFIIENSSKLDLPHELGFLESTPRLKTLLINPPFISSSKKNTREGIFSTHNLFVDKESYDSNNNIAIAIKINHKVGYLFISKEYLSFIVALGNLFKIVDFSDVENKKPEFILFFGINIDYNLCYYYKLEDGTYVGVCPEKANIDYFGYLKKMILTLHNLHMIDERKLPIHGAGIRIQLTNKKSFNVVILGDSGAGKSETIEALNMLRDPLIDKIYTIFDDMGTFEINDSQVYCSGTETGAFVRLDDLEKGYSLRSVDRSVFLNIESVNSRVVIPITTYKETKKLHHVDMFLLADNFTSSNDGIIKFNDEKIAINEFIKGERVAKGTTSEIGKVSTFFANPFGPLQRKEECKELINDIFDDLYKNKIFIGKLFTKLSIDPHNGPKEGAVALLNLLRSI